MWKFKVELKNEYFNYFKTLKSTLKIRLLISFMNIFMTFIIIKPWLLVYFDFVFLNIFFGHIWHCSGGYSLFCSLELLLEGSGMGYLWDAKNQAWLGLLCARNMSYLLCYCSSLNFWWYFYMRFAIYILPYNSIFRNRMTHSVGIDFWCAMHSYHFMSLFYMKLLILKQFHERIISSLWNFRVLLVLHLHLMNFNC